MRLHCINAFGLVVLAVPLLFLCGCGKNKGSVKGKITFDGKPVIFGTIVVADESYRDYRGKIESDGSYALEGVPHGTLKIAIFSPDPKLQAPKEWKRPPGMEGAKIEKKELPPPGPLAIDVAKWFPIPERYNHHETSELTLAHKEKTTHFDIPLK
jgi:hypothetical protein